MRTFTKTKIPKKKECEEPICVWGKRSSSKKKKKGGEVALTGKKGGVGEKATVEIWYSHGNGAHFVLGKKGPVVARCHRETHLGAEKKEPVTSLTWIIQGKKPGLAAENPKPKNGRRCSTVKHRGEKSSGTVAEKKGKGFFARWQGKKKIEDTTGARRQEKGGNKLSEKKPRGKKNGEARGSP